MKNKSVDTIFDQGLEEATDYQASDKISEII